LRREDEAGRKTLNAHSHVRSIGLELCRFNPAEKPRPLPKLLGVKSRDRMGAVCAGIPHARIQRQPQRRRCGWRTSGFGIAPNAKRHTDQSSRSALKPSPLSHSRPRWKSARQWDSGCLCPGGGERCEGRRRVNSLVEHKELISFVLDLLVFI
jgi:hypothetical protein